MTRTTRKSLANKLTVMAIAALTAFVLALQFLGAPAFDRRPGNNSVVQADTMNGVTATYREAPAGMDPNVVALSNSAIGDTAKNEATPRPDEKVSVIVELKGTPLMELAAQTDMTVGEYAQTEEGRNSLNTLSGIRSKALDGVSQYLIERRLNYTTIMNAFSATVRYSDVANIQRNKYVKNVILSNTYLAPKTVTENYVDVYESGIFDSSNIAYDGTGTVVAVVDTGTDYTHDVFNMELDGQTVAITKDDVAAVTHLLTATSLSAEQGEAINEDDLYLTSKLPFAYDYADSDANVYPHEAHGTHVAGIIAGKSDVITGVAPNAQIATIKVFSDYKTGAETEWILAGLNDAVTIGVDAINMSLGTSCGFSREVDEDAINAVYDRINAAGICLVVAASNDYSSAQASTWGNTNLSTNPDSGTVGSPASYDASLSVASVSGVKTKYFVTGGKEVYFAESRLVGKTDANDFVAELLGDRQEAEFEYAVVPGVGMNVNYSGIDVKGKIAVVQRGNTNFEDKVSVASDNGAIGVIVYNNVSGTISMSVGTKYRIPSCFITMDMSKALLDGDCRSGTIKLSKDYLAGPFMSDFSSWGVLPDLTLVPDITAHGGEIYSAIPGGDMYDRMSGTSMACPNMAGALVLVRQSVKEAHPDHSTIQVRDESYSRMMSTATIVRNEEGNPYSPRKQGAGLANIAGSINTAAYLTVDGSNKPKLSLGDDPDRTGVYTLQFNLVNTSGNALSYSMSPYVMTESMSSDGRTVAEKAYMFNDTSVEYDITETRGAAVLNGSNVTVSGYGEVRITATISLSAVDKDYLNRTFANGMYVEGYLMLDSMDNGGVDLNIPYLAFYGDWSDAPMLDVTAYEVGASQADDSVLSEDKLVADVYGTLPFSGFASASSDTGLAYYGMGDFAYIAAPGYEPPPVQEKFAALTTNPDGDYLLYMISAGLLRGAKRVDMEIRNSATGEVIWSGTDYNARKTHASGEQTGGYVEVELDIRELDLPNNSKYTFSMECFLDWKDGSGDYKAGNNNKFSFEFTVDNEAPEISDVSVRKVASGSSYRYYLDISAYDNHYLQGYAITTYSGITVNQNGYEQFVDSTSVTNGMIPVDGNFNSDTVLSLNITSYWSEILANEGKLYVTLVDYAKNSRGYFISIEQEDDMTIELKRNANTNLNINPNGQVDLGAQVTILSNIVDDATDENKSYLEGYWTKDLIWDSSDRTIVDVSKDGLITGIKAGSAVITVRTPDTAAFDETDTTHCLKFNITVSGAPKTIELSGFEMSSDAIVLERGEEATISITAFKPYNYKGTPEIVWSSTSSNVKILSYSDDNKTVTVRAMESGSATIRATVKGGRASGYCSVRVSQEFTMTNNLYLRSYTGRGDENGVVDIPGDMGIVYIYPQAFLGNEYIKKVIIPEGVTTIMRGAFINCSALEEVVLPSTLTTIEKFAFANDNNLKKINLGAVKSIGDSSFWGTDMEEIDLSSCTYIDQMAFNYNRSLKSLDLSRVGMLQGGAFANCSGLTTLDIPANVSMGKPYDLELINGGIVPIGPFAFCDGLKSVTIRSKNIGQFAFFNCPNLTSVTFVNDVEKIGEYAFVYCTKLSNITFNGSVYEIGDYAFAYLPSENDNTLTALKSVTLPDGLTILGANAFYWNRQLSQVTISSGALLSTVDPAAFYCTGVTSYTVQNGNRYLSSDNNGVLFDKNKTRLIAYPLSKSGASARTYTVPSTVKTIGKSAFAYAGAYDSGTYLQTVNLSNVEYIEEYAFYQSAVTTVNAYNSVKYIGNNAFASTGIKSFPITDKTMHIGSNAFSNCYLIGGDLQIPANVEYIGNFAFANTRIKTLSFAGNTKLKTVGAGAFAASTKLESVDFGNLESISDYMFVAMVSNAGSPLACDNLVSVTIPNTVKSIGIGAFEGAALTEVVLSNALTSIAPEAFASTKLTSITLPNSVISIGDGAFADTPLESINLGNVTYIGEHAFNGTMLTAVNAGNVKFVGAHAFDGCELLEIVNMPVVTDIGEYAFSDCVLLDTVTVTSATNVGEYAFNGCVGITSLNLTNVKELGAHAFDGAENLAAVTLGKLEKIGAGAFNGTVVTSIALPATLKSVADGAFLGADELVDISIAKGNDKYMSKDGVLYIVNDSDYYTLVAYPAGKTATKYDVLDRTIKLGAYAFNGNTHLKELTLPVYMRVIGISAMSGMSSLEKLTIYAATAPTLESTGYYQEYDDINKENEYINTYDNFSFEFGDVDNTSLTIYVPSNNTGYDNRIWKSYVGKIITVTDKVHATLATLNLIERIKLLPENPTAADAGEINSLARLINILNPAQRLIVQGGSYSSATVTNIDVEYYKALFKGVNFRDKLTAAQNKLTSAAISGTAVADGVIGETIEIDSSLFIAVVTLCACVVALGAIALVAVLKRRSR